MIAAFAMGILSKTHQSSLTLKGGSTSHLGLLPSGKKRKPLLLVARNHFILWLADHQRSSPAAELRFAVCDRMDTNRLGAAESPEAHSSTPRCPEAHSSTPDTLKPIAARPEGAEALSPGQRPGYNGNGQGALNQRSPAHSGKVKGKSFKIHLTQLSQIGKFKKLKPYALQLNIQTIRLLS